MRSNKSHVWAVFLIVLAGCQTTNKGGRTGTGSSLSSFTIGEFKTTAGDPDWKSLAVNMQRTDGDRKAVQQSFSHDQFKAGNASNLTLLVPQGHYSISLDYNDSSSTVLYKVCASAASRDYWINTPEFKTDIPICKINSTTPAGTVPLTPSSSVTINPVLNGAGTTPAPNASGFGDSSTCKGSDGRVKDGFDDVGGFCVDRSKSFYVQGGEIYNRGTKVLIKGVNWAGLEGASDDSSGQRNQELKLGGLWTGRTMESFVDQMASLGFNAWRLPLSPEALDPSTPAFDGFKSVPEEIEHFLAYTESKGMMVLLDMHNCGKNNFFQDKAAPGHASEFGAKNGCVNYTQDKWLQNLQTLAKIAKAHQNVIGIDLFNEPFGLSWSEWLTMANSGADVILKTNPTLLVFMEGIGAINNKSANGVFWGENLFEAGTNAPRIPLSRLVFSPHIYGPSVADQTYFHASNFPANMPAIWDEHFGYLKEQGYGMVFGEFGGTYVDKDGRMDKTWNDAFVAYFQKRKFGHFFYWALNQNSGDTGGLYTDGNWSVLNQDKVNLLKPLLERQP